MPRSLKQLKLFCIFFLKHLEEMTMEKKKIQIKIDAIDVLLKVTFWKMLPR